MPAPRIGIPIIGGPHWMAGITYVEMLARSIRSLPEADRPELHLIAQPGSLPHVDHHFGLLPLFRGVILLLEPGMDPAPYRVGALKVCQDRRELYDAVDFVYPVLNDAWDRCSASWVPDFQHRYLPDLFSERERADRDVAFGKVAADAKLLVLSSRSVEADFRRFYPESRTVTRMLSFFAFAEQAVDRLHHGINLWHMNPPKVVHLMHHGAPKPEWDRFNICVPFWELPVLPEAWRRPLEAMDLILAPSRFIEGALASTLVSARVRYFRQPLRMPEAARLGREAWGLPPEAMIFLTCFDCGSDMFRKNPAAAVAAFREKFSGREDVLLVLMWVNEDLDDASRRSAAELRGSIAGEANIRIFDRTLPYSEVLALHRAADAFMSLHRSEGLGLGLMEGMAKGEAVIGTGWAGNMDFMRESNSCLVGYQLVPVPSGSICGRMVAGQPARWAEPDIGEAAAWMQRLEEDPGLRRRLGGKAEDDIREFNRVAREGQIFDEVEAMWSAEEAEGKKRPPKVFDILLPSGAAGVQTGPEAISPADSTPSGQAPQVTAIVSTYNSERFSRGCLQNLVEQTLYLSRLGFTPAIGLGEGIRRYCQWYRSRLSHPESIDWSGRPALVRALGKK